jgi:hypothetical protein
MGNYTDRVMSKIPHEMKDARFKHELNRIFREQHIKEKYKMGYRSTVAYTIRFTPDPENSPYKTLEGIKQAKASFNVFLAEAKSKLSGAFDDKCLVVDEDNMAINFFADDVKWYEDYEDVKCHEALMDLSKEWTEESEVPFKGGNKNIGGIFMRIGEEMDDIVGEGWGEHDWDWLSVRRSIVADWMPE